MTATEPQAAAGHISDWRPEDEQFWRQEGSRIAWRTLIITTYNLLFAFATWFMVSAIVVRLTGIGFKLTDAQKFWLAAMPGLAGGSLRIVHTFLIPIYGTRRTVTVSTLLLLVPCVAWAWVVQRPETSFALLMVFAFTAGFGGGNFSSFMPSTSLFFPKRLQGTALAIQAGVGNFGVSVAQFVVPWIIGVSLLGTSQTFTKGGVSSQIQLQNAAVIWIPFILLGALSAHLFLRNVPVRATFGEQLDIFKDRHTWLMTSLYIMTFGSFSGYSAAFPLLIDKVYGQFDSAPDPLRYAFLGPLVGAASRVVFGPVCDWLGGSKVTLLSGMGLLACALLVCLYTHPTSVSEFSGFLWAMLGLFFFAGIGNASTFKQIPMIFPPRQAGGVIGWTAAVGAYGPFVFSSLFGTIIAATGSPTAFFYGAAVFYLVNIGINWWFYTRPGAEKPC